MQILKHITLLAVLAAATTAVGFNCVAGTSVYTYQYDNTRAGANTNETVLTLANVNTNTFGRLFQYSVDGYIYGQPLVVTNVTIPGKGTHNVLYVATEHDTVYAFDADTFVPTPYWTNTFVNLPNTNTIQSANVPKNNLAFANGGGQVGITGTPVIDTVNGTIFVEARTQVFEGGTTNFYHKLHALDITTGQERPNSPANIFATNYPGLGGPNGTGIYGTVIDSSGGHVLWNSLEEQNRPGLLLLSNQVYVAYAQPGDQNPWHGWLFSYNETNLTQTSVYCVTPNGRAGGYWMGGGAPAVDAAGFIYANTGNGDTQAVSNNFGNSYVKYSVTNGIQPVDYFQPFDQINNSSDNDVGSSGLIVLPDAVGSVAHPHLLFGGCKTGTNYLIDRDNLGQFNASSDNVVQEFTSPIVAGKHAGMLCAPAYFNGLLYVPGSGTSLAAYSIANGSINTTPVSTTASPTSAFANGVSPTISANGTSNGICWVMRIDNYGVSAAVLYAFNATNLSQMLYNSSLISARDAAGTAVHFTTPMVANGKVYLPNGGKVTVYGNAFFFPSINTGSISNGVFTLPMYGTPNLSYTLQGSVDFTNWINLSTITPTSSPFNLVDPGASNFPMRYYRAVVP